MPDDIFEDRAGKLTRRAIRSPTLPTRRARLKPSPLPGACLNFNQVFALQYQACAAFLIAVRFQAYHKQAQNRPMIPPWRYCQEIFCSCFWRFFMFRIAADAQEHPALSAAKFRIRGRRTENSNRLRHGGHSIQHLCAGRNVAGRLSAPSKDAEQVGRYFAPTASNPNPRP